MQTLIKHSLYLLAVLAGMAAGAWSSGALFLKFGQPFHFITALIVAVLSAATVRWLVKPQGGPVVISFMLTFAVGLYGSYSVSDYLFEKDMRFYEDISVSAYRHEMKYVSFHDSRLALAKYGRHTFDRYGTHHYFAVPVVGAGDDSLRPVKLWAWARKLNAGQAEIEEFNLTRKDINFGVITNDPTVVGNVRKAISVVAEQHGLKVDEEPVLIEWGRRPLPQTHVHRLYTIILYAMVLAVASSLVVAVWPRLRKKGDNEIKREQRTQ